MTFNLDTSGVVTLAPVGDGSPAPVAWGNLSPFTQGYIEALLRDGVEFFTTATRPPQFGFSDLAPETLARIIADCEEYQRVHADLIGISRHPEGLPRLGRLFWIDRQNATVASFPPLTVQLGDDGKVRFA